MGRFVNKILKTRIKNSEEVVFAKDRCCPVMGLGADLQRIVCSWSCIEQGKRPFGALLFANLFETATACWL